DTMSPPDGMQIKISRYVFFQAEDGIRDFHVTGVQTCALPIFKSYRVAALQRLSLSEPGYGFPIQFWIQAWRAGLRVVEEPVPLRSEERRVGKGSRDRWWRNH